MRGKEMSKRGYGRTRHLFGKEFCACGGLNHMPCRGLCRQVHLTKAGYIKCGEWYRLEPPKRRPKHRQGRPVGEDQPQRRTGQRKGGE